MKALFRSRRTVLLLAGLLVAAGAFALPAVASQSDDGRAGERHHGRTAHEKVLFQQWTDIWNGDYATAPKIIASDFTVHAALLDGGDGSAIRGPEGLVGLVQQIRGVFPDLEFTLEVGPLIDHDHMSGRWIATGTYGGGFPGANAPVGTVVTWTGTDTLRLEHGKLAEYWFNADSHVLLRELQVG
ncbi:ester cyclase [Actinophytocola sediminis]